MSYIKSAVASFLLLTGALSTVSIHNLDAKIEKKGAKKGAKKTKALVLLDEKIKEIREAGFTEDGFNKLVKLTHGLGKRVLSKGSKKGKKGGNKKGAKKAANKKVAATQSDLSEDSDE